MTKALAIFLMISSLGCSQPGIKMRNQIEKAKTLDALLVLGGEQNYSRSLHALDIYNRVEKTRKNPINIVLTGYHSGLSSTTPEKAESEMAKEYLLFKGLPKEVIFNETQSKDTLTNVVYAQPILQKINAKKVGIVTDNYHMGRGLWTAKRVLGKNYEVCALPNEIEGSFLTGVQELMIKYAQKIDLCIAGVKSGDQQAFEKYVRDKHPFYNQNAKGVYKTAINIHKMIHGRKK